MDKAFSSIDLILTTKNNELLLLRRKEEPYKGKLALIGGIQDSHETFYDAIERILKEKTGLHANVTREEVDVNRLGKFPLIQFRTYGPQGDKRGGNTTVFAIETDKTIEELDNFSSTELIAIEQEAVKDLAFEHEQFIKEYFFEKKGVTLASIGEIGVTVDVAIISATHGKLSVLLMQRSKEPHKGKYVLPGGFVNKDESLDEAAKAILKRETNIDGAYLEQLYTFGKVTRDSRGRIISIAYYALLNSENYKVIQSAKHETGGWFEISKLKNMSLGFDHEDIISMAVDRIKNKMEYTNIAFQLLPEKFTLSELQEVYETILERKIDKRNFRKRIAELDMLEELNEYKKVGRMRPAKYYRFKEREKETIFQPRKGLY